MAPPPPPPELIDDAVAEILLRLPPDEPAGLVRASLVCKLWRRLLADPAFSRRYREFHRTPPLLGYLRSSGHGEYMPCFVPTTALPCPQQPNFNYNNWLLIDCRHGRILLYRTDKNSLLVWDPLSGRQWRLRDRKFPFCPNFNTATVLCAADGCNHLDCHGGPFLVVFVDSDDMSEVTRAWVYSSVDDAWSEPASVQVGIDSYVLRARAALVGDEMYFVLALGARILKYELGKNCLALIDSPHVYQQLPVLMPTADGLLGLIGTEGSSIHFWSRKVNPNGVAVWVQTRVIELEKLIPSDNLCSQPRVIGFAEGVGVIFLRTDVGIFTIELKSERVRKVSKCADFYKALPFMSFYTPDCGRLLIPARLTE
ncbi:unnamed protein product [Urochloa decumbens]|uniref:F-box domain-containing protein n=1 Tax=Urochloa decumbens TaxID=240449 RepID=A0ABC9GCY7_9POAL